jgi:DNA-binding transcriptional regulator LsrR (DeoR family)
MSMSNRLTAKVCHLYYREQLTQAEIGARLALSRHKVGRLLRDALAQDIVRIEIRSPYIETVGLERELETALGLKAAVIVDVEESPDEAANKRLVCRAGAEFLAELLTDDVIVGIGWGSTTYELVGELAPQPCPGGRVVQITGGNKALPNHFDCHEVTRRLAEKLGVPPVLLHAPAVVEREKTRNLLLAEPSIAETFALFEHLDVAAVGIGSLVPARSSTLIASGYVPPPDLERLVHMGAVGDVFSYFIDDLGRLVPTPLHDRLIAISVAQIHKIPWSIGIATGPVKARAVRAAVRGGFVNALVVDSRLARAVLELPQDRADLTTGAPAPRGSRRAGAGRD